MGEFVRCISWSAVSSDEQADPKKESLPDQRRLNLEFIDNLSTRYPGTSGVVAAELEVVGSRSIIRYDAAVEAFDAYRQLDEMIAAKSFDVLVCRRRDRLGREESLVITIEALCTQAGIVIAARDSLPPALTPPDEGGRMVNLMQAHMAGAEKREIVRRSRVGRMRRARNGDFISKLPFGWVYEYAADGSRTVAIDEAAAAVIRFALVDCLLTGNMPRKEIIAALNSRGYRTSSGRPFTHTAVRNLISMAPRYAGESEYNSRKTGERATGAGNWPTILTKEEAHAIAAEVGSRRKGSYNWQRRFSRLCYCAKCGAMLSPAGYEKHSATRIQYRCRNKCAGGYIPDDRIMAALRHDIKWLAESANRAEVLSGIPDRCADIERQIDAAHAELDELTTQRNRADHAYVVLGHMSDENYGDIITDIEQRQQDTQRRIDHLAAELAEASHARRLGDRLTDIAAIGLAMLDGDPAEANAWLRRHFRLYVLNNQVSRIDHL